MDEKSNKKEESWWTNLFLRMNERRFPSLIKAFFYFSCPLIIALLFSVVIFNPPTEATTCSEKILGSLRDYSTIILTLGSLPIALTLWLFRNHDIVMNLDLAKYHEALKNIHNKEASVGLRQVAFTTLMELKEKWMWKDKIIKQVFPAANLTWLNLQEVKLQGFNLRSVKLQGAKLQGATLIGVDLQAANLEEKFVDDDGYPNRRLPTSSDTLKHIKLDAADLQGANLQGANLQYAKMQGANLSGVVLMNANLRGATLGDPFPMYGSPTKAYYYENKEAEEKDEKTPVTKKWLREQGALHVNMVKGIPEE